MTLAEAIQQAKQTKRSKTFVRFSPGREHLTVMLHGMKLLYGNVRMNDLINNPPENNSDWHKGSPCIYRTHTLCQEGYCSQCEIERQEQRYREMNSGSYWDAMEDSGNE